MLREDQMLPVQIIAEAGVNHDGSRELAAELVRGAARAGADVVKFQTFKTEESISVRARQADYQARATREERSQLDLIRPLELDFEAFVELRALCDECGIEFLSTAFDAESLDFLTGRLGVRRLKVASGELANLPLLLRHARTRLPVLLSTGMASLGEIEVALGCLAFGALASGETTPSQDAFLEAYASPEGQRYLQSAVTLLHCTTEYPAPVDQLNLRCIPTLGAAFGVPVGYSDHSLGTFASVSAVALGAAVIEKHVTPDRGLPGPDHQASMDLEEFGELVSAIRSTERALGSARKGPTATERANRNPARKSLVARRRIPKGQPIREEDVAIKRPGDGLAPARFWELLGTRAVKDFAVDEPLVLGPLVVAPPGED